MDLNVVSVRAGARKVVSVRSRLGRALDAVGFFGRADLDRKTASSTESRRNPDHVLTTLRQLAPNLIHVRAPLRIQEIPMSTSRDAQCYELRFHSLFELGRGYTFPCDSAGRVELDAMSERERNSYLYARALIGHELSMPAVQLSDR
jgi:hypothetical protein